DPARPIGSRIFLGAARVGAAGVGRGRGGGGRVGWGGAGTRRSDAAFTFGGGRR
ncbi:MAG TPA: RNA-binding protein, partial [Microbacteriaceae bacterium]|nr:RNA-binding protein [Microbacteriaceae bacterium]